VKLNPSLPITVALMLWGLPATAGTVRGTLRLPAIEVQEAQIGPYAGHVTSLPHPAPLVRNAPGDAVIWFESAPPGDGARPAGARPRLVQRGQSFAPRVLAIAQGTTVDFPNDDPIYHNVFSVSPIRRFDLGKYPRGHSRQVTFSRPGLVHVFCDIHASMAAFVLVVPHSLFTQPDDAGRFNLPPVPAGSYVVHIWHPDLPEVRRNVEVPARGDVTLDVSFGS
jgi:hypothetical protein